MNWVYTFFIVVIPVIAGVLIWWGLYRRTGSELVQVAMFLVVAGPWRYSAPTELSEEGVRSAHRAMTSLREMLGRRKALLVAPSEASLRETHSILASTNEYDVIPHMEGHRDYWGILLKLSENPAIEKLDGVTEESVAVLATRSGDVEHLNVILVVDPDTLMGRLGHFYGPEDGRAAMPVAGSVYEFVVIYHRIEGDVHDIRFKK